MKFKFSKVYCHKDNFRCNPSMNSEHCKGCDVIKTRELALAILIGAVVLFAYGLVGWIESFPV